MNASRARHCKRPGRSSSQLCRPNTRARIYLRDGHRCVWCRYAPEPGEKLTLDHVIPRSAGGSNRYWNLVSACHACNSHRGDTPAADFAQRFGAVAGKVALRVLAAVGKPLPVLLPRVALP